MTNEEFKARVKEIESLWKSEKITTEQFYDMELELAAKFSADRAAKVAEMKKRISDIEKNRYQEFQGDFDGD